MFGSRYMQQLIEEGHPLDVEALSTLSPYRTQHINRFGNYVINPIDCPNPWSSTWGFHYRLSPHDSAICVFFTRILTTVLLDLRGACSRAERVPLALGELG